MSRKVFIIKDWMSIISDKYPANIFPTIIGTYSSLSLAKEQILKYTKVEEKMNL